MTDPSWLPGAGLRAAAELLALGHAVTLATRTRTGTGRGPVHVLADLDQAAKRAVGELPTTELVSLIEVLASLAGSATAAGGGPDDPDGTLHLRRVCTQMTQRADLLDAAVAEVRGS
ncbi:hypothetical protein [Rhodococcus koreensis]